MKLKYIFPMLAALAMQACSDSKSDQPGDDDGSAEVTITTEVVTRATLTTAYKDGDQMNVFAKAYNSATSEDKFPPMCASYAGGQWTLNPKLRIAEGQLAFLYAVSPYDKAYTDPSAIPVDASKQLDLLYSGSAVPVNFNNRQAKFTMKHAFALVSFNIVATKSEAELQSISISGSKIYTKGTFDAEKAKFTGTSADQMTLPVSATITANGWSENFPQMWFIPFSTKSEAAQLTAVINGKTYVVQFPEVTMASGNQYIFRLTYSDYGLEFVPSMTEVIALDQTTDDFSGLENYGEVAFTLNGVSSWTLPALTGFSVFGRYLSGNESATYRVESVQTVDFANPSADNRVGIESWNSTGFEVESLEGITEVDITRY